MKQEDNNLKHLGTGSSYAVYTNTVDSTLLDPIERAMGRQESGLSTRRWKEGYDVWNAYEMTFLLDNGLPIAGTLKICYTAKSLLMVESKSLKLYLNTFDMAKMGPTIIAATNAVINRVQEDLTNLLGVYVSVEFHSNADNIVDPFSGYQDIYELLNGLEALNDIKVEDYTMEEDHLIFVPASGHVQNLHVSTNILRSRCEKTHQKDSGTAFIYISTRDGFVDLISLLKQIISLREKSKFHENCCEKLFDDIAKLPGVIHCSVSLLYARRGGIDINPIRATSLELIPSSFIDCKKLNTKTLMQ